MTNGSHTVTGRSGLRRVMVDGHAMAYVESGTGDPIVLLHGNPTSSFVWRGVLPHLDGLGRCIAPDLIGMGDSDKLTGSGPGRYRFVEHRRFLDAFLDAIGVRERVVFVGHDWGGALAFDWANRYREAVAGLCYLETIVRPLAWDEWPVNARRIFQAMRSNSGERLCLEDNAFVERILPASVRRELDEEEMAVYRTPFSHPGESRRPTLAWARELPLDGEPRDVVDIVADYARWLATTSVPKLFVNGDPGSILTGAQREDCRAWPHQTEVTVPGIHFLQEDSADAIGTAIADWYETLR